MASDTIFALSSGRPPAAIAVIRLCGPQAGAAVEALAGRIPEPRRAMLSLLRDPVSGETLDEALVLLFPGPASETGEDMAELQVHGGRAVIAGVLAALGALPGLRPAEAGEFTRRAFDNGRLDLTEVEGLADLIAADSALQRRQALRHYRGALGEQAGRWRERLIEALALVEARIDFSDEADVPEDLLGPARAILQQVHDAVAAVLVSAGRGERLREGFVVAIAGAPNAGKSTLLNTLAGRDAAIVSPVPGTTRDVVEVHLDLEGLPVTLLDTAGLRDSADPVEQEGMRRARARAAGADLVLWVADVSEKGFSVEGEAHAMASALPGPEEVGAGGRGPVWLVMNKVDQLDERQRVALVGTSPLHKRNGENQSAEFALFFPLSAPNSQTCCGLSAAMMRHFNDQVSGSGLVARARHRELLTDLHITTLSILRSPDRPEELVAEDIRGALSGLASLTGRTDSEEILDALFGTFCIGK